jgi:FkbM family methyltransferase
MLMFWKSIGKPIDNAMRQLPLPLAVTRFYGWCLRQSLMLYFKHFQKNTANNYIASNLNKGDVFIDIGANEGSILRLASGVVGATGHVFAFEPQQRIYRQLCKTIERYGWNNCTLFQTLVGDYDGDMTFYEYAEMDKFSSLAQGWVDKEATTVQYPMVQLDTWIEMQQLTRLDFIKIDVEGAELKVLQGSQKTLQQFAPIVLLEIGQQEQRQKLFNYTISDVFHLFRTVGYNRFYTLTATGLRQLHSASDLHGDEQDMVAIKHSEKSRS